MRVAVIGAGAVGSASARALSARGASIVVFEQFDEWHEKGSSHGTSRIIRKAYQDPYYAGLMEEVFPLWHQLEAETGATLYHETGILVFGKPDSEYLHGTRESLQALRLPFEPLGHVEVARRFGGFHIDPDEEAIFQDSGGYLRADLAIRAMRGAATASGAEFRFAEKAYLEDGLVNGESFDVIVVCVGPWTSSVVGRSEMVPHLQRFAYFDAPMEPKIPVWIDGSVNHFYGTPNYGRGFKVGRHRYGPSFDPNTARPADEEAVKQIASEARKRLGADVMLEACECVYTVAPEEDFRIGKLPFGTPAFWASPCSGHGFKFSIWFGELMARLVMGEAVLADYPRFAVQE